MNAHVLEMINTFYRPALDRLFVKIKVFARKKYFYRFINLLTDPSFSVLFVLNYFYFQLFDFQGIQISLNFVRQSKQQFIYILLFFIELCNLLCLL